MKRMNNEKKKAQRKKKKRRKEKRKKERKKESRKGRKRERKKTVGRPAFMLVSTSTKANIDGGTGNILLTSLNYSIAIITVNGA